MLGLVVNEAQRSLNGIDYEHEIVPYGMYMPYPKNTLPAVPPIKPHILWGCFVDIPNDFEAGGDLQYTPVREAWYYGSQLGCSGGCSRGSSYGRFDQSSADELHRLNKIERTQTFLQTISAASIAIVATLTVIKYFTGRDSFK
jgi:hypothetical protein